MTRAEIVAVLGEPDTDSYFASCEMVYVLGPERSFISIDYEWLGINLDEENCYVNSLVATD